MRAVPIVMGCLALGALATATAQTTTAVTPAAAVTTSAPSPAPAAAAAPPAASAAPAAAATAAAAPTTYPMDKKMISKGYKPEMAGGERVYCRKEDQIGSHLPAKKICLTAQQAEQAEHDAKEFTEQVQRSSKPIGGG